GPADVDLGVMHVVRGDPEHLFLLQRAVGNDYVRVYVSSDGEVWHRARRQEQLSMSRLVVSSGITHSKVLYRLSDGASQVERSTDNGRTWVPAKLDFHKANGEHKQRTRTNITILGTHGLTLYARAATKESPDSSGHSWPDVYVSRDGGDNWQLFATDLVVG